MKGNNKGLSLVELIVVIAIMAVLIGIGTFSLSLLFGTQAKSCAQKVSAMLSETKTGCMSRFDETMTLSYRKKVADSDPGYDPSVTSDGYYAENRVFTMKKDASLFEAASTQMRRMGSPRVVITVHLTDGTVFELGENNSITVSFDRASGAFEEVAATVDGNPVTGYIDRMTFQSGLRTFTITMVAETGKHTLQG